MKAWASTLVLVGFIMTAADSSQAGQPAPLTPADKSIRAYMSARAAELEREFLPGIVTSEDFEEVRPALRQAYFDMLGLWPLPERTPLNAKVTGKLEQPGYVVEKLHFQSRPGLYVTANLYRPEPAQGRYPAIVYQCGHSYMQRDGNKSAYQDHGIWFATHGYIALVIDSLQLGEIASFHHGTYREQRWWWQSAGYVPSGVECWNAMRAIDYLVSRPDVDPDRIGATGISGGGAGTVWISAADERIKASAPVSGLSDLGFYVGEDGVNGHCDCMFVYNQARWNWTNIPALIAPRPLLFVNSDADPIYPIGANERIINRLKRLYSRFGLADKVDAMVSVGTHAYRADLRRAVFEFFNRSFKYDAHPVEDAESGLKPLPPNPTIAQRDDTKPRHLIEYKKLRVFPEDADLPTDSINAKIDQSFVQFAKVELPKAGGFEAWRKDLVERLRARTFAAWPTMPPAFDGQLDAPGVCTESTEEGLKVCSQWLPGRNKDALCTLIVLNESDEPGKVPDWAREIVGEGATLVLNPRGTGANAWRRKNPPNTVEREMVLLGMTVDSGRVWDILTVLRRRLEGKKWQLAGQGNAGILAAYAALYEPAVTGVIAVNPPPSHMPGADGVYGPPLLNVLRVLDIPEALGCLAPRKLVLIGARDPAFERTAAIYKLAGAQEKFEKR
ncbi:MAG TPA: prolyl oligopeptidase family serine peptidase [Planctomycetota bacterium]|jgi:dienelactone hydrolase